MFDYSTNNTTDWVRLSSNDFWFGFVRSISPGLRRVGPKLVFAIFFFGIKNTFQGKNHTTFSLRSISRQKKLRSLILHRVPLLARYWGGHNPCEKHCTAFTDFQTQNWLFFRFFTASRFFLKRFLWFRKLAIMAGTLIYVLTLFCFLPLAGLHFRMKAAKFSSILSLVSNCRNFKEDADNCDDLGYLIPVIQWFRQSCSFSTRRVISLLTNNFFIDFTIFMDSESNPSALKVGQVPISLL